jgi:hypothetical protein
MTPTVAFILGMLSGFGLEFLALLVYSLCAVAKRADEQAERLARERAENARKAFMASSERKA